MGYGVPPRRKRDASWVSELLLGQFGRDCSQSGPIL